MKKQQLLFFLLTLSTLTFAGKISDELKLKIQRYLECEDCYYYFLQSKIDKELIKPAILPDSMYQSMQNRILKQIERYNFQWKDLSIVEDTPWSTLNLEQDGICTKANLKFKAESIKKCLELGIKRVILFYGYSCEDLKKGKKRGSSVYSGQYNAQFERSRITMDQLSDLVITYKLKLSFGIYDLEKKEFVIEFDVKEIEYSVLSGAEELINNIFDEIEDEIYK